MGLSVPRSIWALGAQVSHSPVGPRSSVLADGGRNFLEVSYPAADGTVILRQRSFDQVWRIANTTSEVQYCSQGQTAPFEVVPPAGAGADADSTFQVCWRNSVRRLPTFPAGCSGCNCARWTFQVRVLSSTFLMLRRPSTTTRRCAAARAAGPEALLNRTGTGGYRPRVLWHPEPRPRRRHVGGGAARAVRCAFAVAPHTSSCGGHHSFVAVVLPSVLSPSPSPSLPVQQCVMLNRALSAVLTTT